MARTDAEIKAFVSRFMTAQEIEEVAAGRSVTEVYQEGGFCHKCPAFKVCPVPFAEFARMRMKGEQMPNPMSVLALLAILQGNLEIGLGESQDNAPENPEDCFSCPVFGKCDLPAAKRAAISAIDR